MEEENWEKGKNALVRFEKSTTNHPLQESRETKRGDETELTWTTKSQVNKGDPAAGHHRRETMPAVMFATSDLYQLGREGNRNELNGA